MKPAIIVLRPDDAGALARLHADGFDTPWSAAEFRKLLNQSTILALGIEMDEVLVAFILVQMSPDAGDILTLATATDYRRKGYARQLVSAMALRLGERGIATLTLDVAADNTAALALYQNLGFNEDGRRRNYYRRGAEPRVDAILMSRPVPGHLP